MRRDIHYRLHTTQMSNSLHTRPAQAFLDHRAKVVAAAQASGRRVLVKPIRAGTKLDMRDVTIKKLYIFWFVQERRNPQDGSTLDISSRMAEKARMGYRS